MDKVLDLKAVVLDKLAKEHGFKDWNSFCKAFYIEDDNGEPVFNIQDTVRTIVKEYTEEGIELALTAKQAEIFEVIEEIRGASYTNVGYCANQDKFVKSKDGNEILISELKKRLQAKAVNE